MAQVDQQTTSGPPACIDVADLLAKVNQEIATYESRKLTQLKSELEGFVSKKQQVVDDYGKQYDALVAKWKAQNTRVADLSARLKCLFPHDQWKTYITECVCSVYGDIATETQALQTRLDCGRGPLERANIAAQAAFATAKAYLDTLTANTAQINAALGADDKQISAVAALLDGPDKGKAIYAFWFNLLPTHVQLAPADLVGPCLGYAEGEEPWDLCGTIAKPDPKAPHPVPWLLDPADYGDEIDCAWTRYRDARDAAAKASADFAAAPDDIAAAQKALDADNKGRDDKILACLATKSPPGPCDDQAAQPATATTTTTTTTATTTATPATTTTAAATTPASSATAHATTPEPAAPAEPVEPATDGAANAPNKEA